MYTHILLSACMYIYYVYIHENISMYVYIYMYLHEYIYIHAYIHTLIHTYIHMLSMYMYIHTETDRQREREREIFSESRHTPPAKNQPEQGRCIA